MLYTGYDFIFCMENHRKVYGAEGLCRSQLLDVEGGAFNILHAGYLGLHDQHGNETMAVSADYEDRNGSCGTWFCMADRFFNNLVSSDSAIRPNSA